MYKKPSVTDKNVSINLYRILYKKSGYINICLQVKVKAYKKEKRKNIVWKNQIYNKTLHTSKRSYFYFILFQNNKNVDKLNFSSIFIPQKMKKKKICI